MNDEPVSERVTGKVSEYQSRRGFGFIVPDGEEEEDKDKKPDDDKDKKIFVHWKQIETDDRWPALSAGMKVAFSLKEEKGRKFAVKVTKANGEKIAIGEDADKNYNMDKIYKGKVKFYDLKKGFGFITPVLEEGETKLEWQGESVDMEKGIYIAREEIHTDDEPPALNDGSDVEFRIFHSSKGLGCGHVTGPAGAKIVHKFVGQKRRRVGNAGGAGWGRGRKRQRQFGGGGRPFRMGMGGGPGSLLTMDADTIEVGLHIENKFVGRLIGKGGESVKQIRKDSGAILQFGERSPYGMQRQKDEVVSIVGEKDQIIKACMEIAKKIKEFAGDEGRQDNLVFLIPDSFCGMFIGKGGAILKKVREDSGVKINVSNVPIQLAGGSLVSLAKVVGDIEQIEKACQQIVPKLGSISRRILENQMQAFSLRGGW